MHRDHEWPFRAEMNGLEEPKKRPDLANYHGMGNVSVKSTEGKIRYMRENLSIAEETCLK